MNKFKYIYFLFCLYSTTCPQEMRFEHITNKQGISQNTIGSICQDSIGFLWFGTYDGLNRYDGYNFKIFKHDPDDSTSISNNFIRYTCVDRNGTLWVGTMSGGLNRYDQDTESFISYHFNKDDSTSISENSITTICADKNNTLWIGTAEQGLNKLVYIENNLSTKEKINNPEKIVVFKRYNYSTVGSQSADWNRITAIFEDHLGYIWIGTRSGLTKYIPQQDQFIHYLHNPNNPRSLTSSDITSISQDRYNNIWIGTWDGGLNRYDSEQDCFIQYPYRNDARHGPSNEIIMSIYRDRAQDLWIGTRGGGLNKLIFNDNTNSLTKKYKKYPVVSFNYYQHDPNELSSLSDNTILSIFEDHSGVLWIGTDWQGLNKYDKYKNKFNHQRYNPNRKNSLNQNLITSFYKDKNNILWIGTRLGGINLFDQKHNRYNYYMHQPDNPFSLLQNSVRTIIEDKEGVIWIGTETGLNRFDTKQKKFYPYSNQMITEIFALGADHLGNIWIGTYSRGLIRLNPQTNSFKQYLHNSEDTNSIGSNIIWAIHEDRQGNLWIGADDGGLNKYDWKNDSFIRYANSPDDSLSISSNKILTMLEGQNGDLWLGTTNGLNRMIRPDKNNTDLSYHFISYTTKDGLPTNTIHGILEDEHGNLWISTNNGLSKFDPLNDTFKNYDVSDGLQDNEFYVGSCFRDVSNGMMYFGGRNGFNFFHPDSIHDNTVIPRVVLTDLKLFNKSVPIGYNNKQVVLEKSIIVTDKIILSYHDNVFSLDFAALHFNSPEKNQFAYKLTGFESEWNYIRVGQKTATYTNLNPGKYIFQVKAANCDGIWNTKPTDLKIIIDPPFWLTWWFRILMTLIIIGLVIYIYKSRTRRIKVYNKELEEHVKLRTQQLETSNKELEAFAYSVSHDLRTPLRGINGYAKLIEDEFSDTLNNDVKKYLEKIMLASRRMGNLIDSLLKLSRIIRTDLKKESVNLSKIASEIFEELKVANPERQVEIKILNGMYANVDIDLIRIALENLIQNAWKFTEPKLDAVIEFGLINNHGVNNYYIKDNGVGLNMQYANKLFTPFNRLHSEKEFEGMGIGLASVKKVIEKHGGKIWVESKINEGAIFFFTLE